MRAPGKIAVAAAAGVTGLALVGAIIALILAPRLPIVEPVETPDAAAAPTWAGPAAEVPLGADGLPDPAWMTQTSAATGIGERALQAYVRIALQKAAAMPECRLSWTTLAGVGATESGHGTYAGSVVGANGTVSPPIFGIALDGVDTAHVPDSDGGAIDGDATIDRAVGPMQLIPQTWRNWHTDGGGDGIEDPQNIDDAVAAAANYLCRSSIDMDTEAGWRAAVAAYNGTDSYLLTVARFATTYNEAVAAA